MLNNKRFVDTFAMTTPLTSHIEKQFKQTIVEVICSSHDLTWQTVIRLSLKLTRLSEMSDSVVSR